jgi:hypothetical protein
MDGASRRAAPKRAETSAVLHLPLYSISSQRPAVAAGHACLQVQDSLATLCGVCVSQCNVSHTRLKPHNACDRATPPTDMQTTQHFTLHSDCGYGAILDIGT